MTTTPAFYPIGTPGTAWGAAERAQWLSRQRRHRSYEADVLPVIDRLRADWDVVEYGRARLNSGVELTDDWPGADSNLQGERS